MTVREQLEQKYGKAPVQPPVQPTGGSVRAQLEAKYKTNPAERYFDVPETPVSRQNRYTQAVQDAKTAEAEAKKYKGLNFAGQFGKEIVSRLANSEVGLGKTIAKTFGNQSDIYSSSIDKLYGTQAELLKQIRQKENEGQDTTNLKRIFNDNIKLIQENKAGLGEEANIPKTSTVLGQLGGTAFDLLTAGTYGKAIKAMKTGKLFRNTKAMEAVTTATGMPELGKIAKQKASGLLSKQGLLNVGKGGSLGYVSDVTQGLQGARGEDREGMNAFIPGFGTALGTSIPLVSEATKTISDMMNPEIKVQKVVNENKKTLSKINDKYSTLRKVTEKNTNRGYDVLDDLANTDLLAGSVDNTGTIRTQNSVDELNRIIKPAEDTVRANLEKEGRKLPISFIEKTLKKDVYDSSLEGEALSNALNKVEKEVQGLKLRADKDGFISLAKIHDAKVNKYATLNYLDPSSKIADKTIARSFKELVTKNSRSIDVDKVNKELGRFYAMQDFLEKLDGKKVEGGKLGKYFAQTVGGMVGSHFGPIGTIIGAEAGGRIKGASFERTLSGKTGKQPVRSQVLEEAIQSGKPNPAIELPPYSNNLGNRNISQTNTIIPTKNGISNSISDNLRADNIRALEQMDNAYLLKTGGTNFDKTGTIDDLFKTNENLNFPVNVDGTPTAPKLPKKGFFEGLKDIPNRQGGFAKIGRDTIDDIHPEDLATMRDFTDYMNGAYKLDPVKDKKIILDLKLAATRIAEKYKGNKFPVFATDKKLANSFSEYLDEIGFDKNFQKKKIIPTRGTGGKFTGSQSTNSLVNEAKKYKSAEEFVKAQTGNQGIYDKVYEKIIKENRLKAEPFDFEFMQSFGSTPEIKGDKVKIYRATTNGKILPGDNVSIYDVRQYIGPDKKGLNIMAAKMGITKLSGRDDIKFVEQWIPKKDLYQTPAGTQLYAPNGIKSLADIWKKANKPSSQAGNVSTKSILPYKEKGDLTTKILRDLEGKKTVSKQYILDATNRGDLKQVERDLIRDLVKNEGDTVEVAKFADKVKSELLPLKVKSSDVINPKFDQYSSRYMNNEGSFSTKYDNVALPDELRGKVANYKENIYESPIKTSAGDVHFGYQTKNYFGHTRIEDMADNKTRRVIEVQSDLYQKGNLENMVQPSQQEIDAVNSYYGLKGKDKYTLDKLPPKSDLKDIAKYGLEGGSTEQSALKAGNKNLQKLQQYNDPTAHFRMIREEIKKASQDGKTKLQFPTGETSMLIEGLGQGSEHARFFRPDIGDALTVENMKVGQEVTEGIAGQKWIITDKLENGKFKAIPKERVVKELSGNFQIPESEVLSFIKNCL